MEPKQWVEINIDDKGKDSDEKKKKERSKKF